jgi:hypothetical protein
VKLNNKAILGQDITSFYNTTNTTAIASQLARHSGFSSTGNDDLTKIFPEWKRELMAKSSKQAPAHLSMTAEIKTLNGSWLPVPVAIDTHSQTCFVADSFVKTFNLDRFVTQPPDSLVIKAHLHQSLMISDRALWIRIAIDNVVSDVMAYVVDNAESEFTATQHYSNMSVKRSLALQRYA